MRLIITLLLFTNLTLFSQGIDKEPLKEVLFKTLTDYQLPIEIAFYAEEHQLNDVKKAVPKQVRILDGKKVKIKGFMVPIEYSKDYKVTTFLLAPDRTSCCYGKVPNLNGFIYSTNEKGVPYIKDKLIEVTGTLYTEPRYYKKHECVLIYKMEIKTVKELKHQGPNKGIGF